jgi:transcriptional regulator with XRE-family HTH domain
MNATMAKGKTDFAARLRALRLDRGFTVKELAARAGLHPMGVTKLERGEREPNWPTVLKLCQALAVTCEAFVGPPTPPEGRKKK